jgi:hypothetical protein
MTADQERGLAAALDAIVPPRPDGRLPGAGAMGLAAEVWHAGPEVGAALAALDDLARRGGHAGFGAVPAADRAAVLAEIAGHDPALFGALVMHAYAAYYQQARDIEALGMEPRPPYPGGHVVPPLDPALVEPVRRMRKRYRDV